MKKKKLFRILVGIPINVEELVNPWISKDGTKDPMRVRTRINHEDNLLNLGVAMVRRRLYKHKMYWSIDELMKAFQLGLCKSAVSGTQME